MTPSCTSSITRRPLPRARQLWIALYVLVLLAAASAHAQSLEPRSFGAAGASLRFEHLGVEDGLVDATVSSMMQDRQGFLWLGTLGGLHRYDGHDLKVYAPTPFDTTSLSGSFVWGISEAQNGDVWVTTRRGGLNRLNRATDTFTHYRHVPGDSASFSSAPPFYPLEDRAGDLWVSTVGGGLSRMRAGEDGRFTHYRHDPDDPTTLSSDALFAMKEDADGQIWIASANGLNRLDPETKTVTRFLYDPDYPGGYGVPQNVMSLYLPPDEPGIVWLATGNGLVRLDSETGDHERFSITEGEPDPVDVLWFVVPDPSVPDVLWAAGQGSGVVRFDVRTGEFTSYRHDPGEPSSLSGNDIRSMMADRSGMIWVGAASAGLNAFNPQALSFTHLRHDPDDRQSLAPGAVWGVYEDRKGTLWVQTGVGWGDYHLTQFDRATGRIVRHRPDPNDPAALPMGVFFGYVDDEAGRLWVGGPDVGLSRLDPTTGRATRFLQEDTPENEGRNNILELIPTAADPDVLWIASVGGLDRFDTRTGAFTPFPLEVEGLGTVDRVATIAHDAEGILWAVATRHGLLRVDPATGAVTLASAHDPRDPTTISGSHDIRGLLERTEEPGILWLADAGGGLNRFDTRTGKATHYTANEGLPNSSVRSLLEDDRGMLWLSTSQGISSFDPATETFRNYGLDDGLMELGSDVRAKGARGTLYLASTKGVTAFDPERLHVNTLTPPVAFTDFRVFNRSVVGRADSPLQTSLAETESITLRHDQNEVTFDFVALHFANPDQNRYAYQLEGYDDRWVEAGTRRSATYTNLPAGNYTFRVKAANADGVWNEEGVSVGMHITPPWWATWWAYLGYVLLTLGLLTAAYRARRRRHELRHRMEIERLEAENLRALDRAKSQFFANVSHEFRTPLTLTLGPLDDVLAGEYGPVSDEVTAPLGLAQRSAGRVLGLINQILDVSRLEAGSTPLRARRLDLGAFAEAQIDAFIPLAVRRRITVEVDKPDAAVEVWADPDHVGTVLVNLLSNAFKFTPEGGSIRVAVGAESTEARVSVRDTGPGIAEADLPRVFDRFYQAEGGEGQPLGSGIGLALAHELAALHGGTLTAESEVGVGSAFTLTLPLGHDHLAPEQIDDRPWDGAAVAVPLPEDEAARTAETDPDDEDVTTVLVADDHADIRAYVRRHLEGAGYRVIEAADGEEALATARERLPDLVVSDVMMPRLDGLGLCRALRADPETDFIPVILLTAKAAQEDKLEGLAELADDYLTKPFDVRELVARVDNLIALRRRLRERFAEGLVPSGDGAVAAVELPPTVSPADEAFVVAVREAVEANLSDETFDVGALAEAVGQSRSHLLRKTNALFGSPPSEIIRTARLDRAAHLLTAQAGTVSEIAYAVGFKSVAHFSNAFLAHTGHRPSAYAEAVG